MGEVQYILGIDQGTTGSTALVSRFDVANAQVTVLAKKTVSFEQHYPQPGWVEHCPQQIWDSVRESCLAAVQHAQDVEDSFHKEKISAVGITNQRETTAFLRRSDLSPLRRAIVWQCKRSVELCKKLKLQSGDIEQNLMHATGLKLDPYFSATKIKWALENDPQVRQALDTDDLLIGTIDTFLVAKLTGGESVVTEPSNACRTLLYNMRTLQWDDSLLQTFGLEEVKSCLPVVQDSFSLFGRCRGLDFLTDGVPIYGILGDQQAALLGHGCTVPGDTKCTYGTGAFALMQLGDKPVYSKHGLLTTVAWKHGEQTKYALEGSAFIAGAAVQFIRDALHFVDTAAETESLAAEVIGAPQVYFVPALAGLGAPWWSPESRGAFFGLTRATTKAQMVRAALEGMAFQVCDLLASMEKDSFCEMQSVHVDGGASANSILMQTQSDLSQVEVCRPTNLETTALGACFAAALGGGWIESVEQVKSFVETEKNFTPQQGVEVMQAQRVMLRGWHAAVECVQGFSRFQASLASTGHTK
ncbi:MAG: glycerol kinase GlpK [Zetaproteobacteria bacterium]|nr:glycerol kinase GlpK [Zetaproteobacteria bacterium]